MHTFFAPGVWSPPFGMPRFNFEERRLTYARSEVNARVRSGNSFSEYDGAPSWKRKFVTGVYARAEESDRCETD